MSYDVIIAGCGPTGGVLANFLRRSGHKIAVIDRDAHVFPAARAMQLDAESCRILHTIDIMERLAIADARPANRHIFVDQNRKPLAEMKFELAGQPLGYPAAGMRFHQPSMEKILREELETSENSETFFGWELVNIDNTDTSVKVQLEHTQSGERKQLEGKYLIGADGGASLCRKAITDKRVDFNYSRQWIVIDILVHDDKIWNSLIDRSEFRCRPDSAVVFVPGHHRHVRFDFEVTDEIAKSFTEADGLALISEYFDPSSVEFIRCEPYHFYAGMPVSWRKGRVLIAGDAAHLTSPFSGQGLNMGVRDAANVAFKLDLILKDGMSDALLDTYQEERWSNCEQYIQGATTRGQMISAGDFWGRFKRNFGFFVARMAPKLAIASMKRSSSAFPYVDGLVGNHALSGHQFPQPKVLDQNRAEVLLDDLTGYGFYILSKGDTGEGSNVNWFRSELGGHIFKLGDDFQDPSGVIQTHFDKHDINHILIRPDRYVFGAEKTSDALCAQLRAALSPYTRTKEASI